MREIKFRGKRATNDIWVYGSYLYSQVDDAHYIKGGNFGYGFTDHEYDVKPETVGQYTGLKDKNGKEIYEGDVAKIELSSGFRIIAGVKWVDGVFCWVANQFCVSIKEIAFNLRNNNVGIIDNIHDNPDILGAV